MLCCQCFFFDMSTETSHFVLTLASNFENYNLLYHRDEIFLDYGSGWERAWQKHQEEWAPPMENDARSSYTSVKELNDRMAPPRSLAELAKKSFPGYVVTGCIYNDGDGDSHNDFDPGLDWTRLSSEEIINRFSKDGSIFVWHEGTPPPQVLALFHHRSHAR